MNPKPWAQAMLNVLDDGQAHTLDELLAIGMPLVPPGIAHREGERLRLTDRPNVAPTTRTKGNAIPTGARALCRRALTQRAERGNLTRTGNTYQRNQTLI